MDKYVVAYRGDEYTCDSMTEVLDFITDQCDNAPDVEESDFEVYVVERRQLDVQINRTVSVKVTGE